MTHDFKLLEKQANELAELWGYLELDAAYGDFPRKDVKRWMLVDKFKYSAEEIESALAVLSGKDGKVENVVQWLAVVLRNARLESMTPEQRDAKISEMRSIAGTIGARRGHEAKMKAAKLEFTEACKPQVAGVSQDLLGFAGKSRGLLGLPGESGCGCEGVGVVEGVSESGSATASVEELKKAAAPPSFQSETKEKTQTKTNGVGGVSPNKEEKAKAGKTKTLKTARGPQAKPEGFDGWTPVQRTEWIVCTCDFHVRHTAEFPAGTFSHRLGCPALAPANGNGNGLNEPGLGEEPPEYWAGFASNKFDPEEA